MWARPLWHVYKGETMEQWVEFFSSPQWLRLLLSMSPRSRWVETVLASSSSRKLLTDRVSTRSALRSMMLGRPLGTELRRSNILTIPPTLSSNAISTPPSVPFLNPIGIPSALASSLCTCDSVVRAPIAPHATRSAVYCGEMVSRNSQAAGRPRALTSWRTFRAVRRPWLILKEPFIWGSGGGRRP